MIGDQGIGGSVTASALSGLPVISFAPGVIQFVVVPKDHLRQVVLQCHIQD